MFDKATVLPSFPLKLSRNISTFIIQFCNIRGLWFFWQKFLSYSHKSLQGLAVCPTVFNCRLLVNVSDYIGSAIYEEGLYDLDLIWFLRKYLRKGDVFCDVGANIGDTSCITSRFVGEKGYIYAFEPSTDNYKMLCANIQINNIRNMYPSRIGIGSGNLVAYIYVRDPSNRGADSIALKKGFETCEAVQVKSIDFLMENNELKTPNVIKIDVEGYELEVLRGATDLLKSKQPPILILEHANVNEERYNGKEIFNFIKEVNSSYRIYEFNNRIVIKQFELIEIVNASDMKGTDIYCFPYAI